MKNNITILFQTKERKVGKMEETKENKKVRKGKHKAKATIGDIIFRILIMLAIFFIAVISYVFYIRGIV